jgi:hypothetical protein
MRLFRLLPVLLFPAAAGAQVRQPPRRPAPAPKPATAPAPKTVAPVPKVPLARITGEVIDSLSVTPLVEATVQFVAADDPSQVRTVRTDSIGQFFLDSMRVGTYLVGIIHEQVDRLGLENRVIQVNIEGSGDVSLALGLPTAETMLRLACGSAGENMDRGAFMGLVRTSRGAPLEGNARVRVQYLETVVSQSGGVSRRFPSRFADARPNGAFVLCGVPPEATITTRAYAGPDSSGVIEVPVPRSGLLVRDMVIASPVRVAKIPASATERPQTLLKGPARVRGVVRDSVGLPLVGARVSVPGTGAEGTSSGGGLFTFDSLPGGSWMVEARAVGFEPRRVAVDFLDATVAEAEIRLEGLAPRLDTVKVQADRWTREMAAFEERRKQGGGYFLDDLQLEKRNAVFVSDMMRGTPGITVIPGGGGGRDRVLMRGTAGAGSCAPAIFLNGMNTPVPDGQLDNLVASAEVRGVEVYTRTGSTPPQFQSRNGCGSIVIWTGQRRRPTDR